MQTVKTRFLEDFTPAEKAALEVQYGAKISGTGGWFNRHFYALLESYYCNHCQWKSPFSNRIRFLRSGIQKFFLAKCRKHLQTHGVLND